MRADRSTHGANASSQPAAASGLPRRYAGSSSARCASARRPAGSRRTRTRRRAPSTQRPAGMALRHARHHRDQQAAEEADEQRVRRRAAEHGIRRSARTSALCAAYSANATGSHAYRGTARAAAAASRRAASCATARAASGQRAAPVRQPQPGVAVHQFQPEVQRDQQPERAEHARWAASRRWPATTLPAKNGNIRWATVKYTGSSRPKLPNLIATNISRAS